MEKSEIICANPNTTDSILSSLRGAQVVEPTKATLLGSSIGDVHSISDVFTMKIGMLKRMGDRLEQLSAQDAILLVRHSFALPKFLYNLRTSPCFLSPVLQEYDKLLQAIMGRITNIHFTDDDPAWAQATLPVKTGYSECSAACTFCLSGLSCCLLRPCPTHHPASSTRLFTSQRGGCQSQVVWRR